MAPASKETTVSIEIHCTHCGKLIRAPDSAGGRHGTCPYCQQSVYIPTPATGDAIPVAPIDPEEERRAAALRDEALAVSATVDKDTGPAYDTAATPPRTAGRSDDARIRADAAGDVIDVAAEIQRFVLAMRDSQLDKADRVVRNLRRGGTAARDHVETLLADEMPAPIGDLPVPLMKGFLNTLLERLK